MEISEVVCDRDLCFFCTECPFCPEHGYRDGCPPVDFEPPQAEAELRTAAVRSVLEPSTSVLLTALVPLRPQAGPEPPHPLATPGLVVKPIPPLGHKDLEEELATRPTLCEPRPHFGRAPRPNPVSNPVVQQQALNALKKAHDAHPKLEVLVKSHQSDLGDSEHEDGSAEDGEIVAEFVQEIFVTRHQNDQPVNANVVEPGKRKRYQRFRQKQFVCDFCNGQFTLKQNVQTHIFAYHMTGVKVARKSKRYKCILCSKVFKTLKQAQAHINRDHLSKDKVTYSCEICEKVFNSSTLLKEHISISHLNERPFECGLCGAKFGRRGGLRRHNMMVHENFTYHCPYEDCTHPGYKCSKALAAHIRAVHTNDRPYGCDYCGRRFVRKNDLKVHEATHGRGAVECEICSRTFSRRTELQRHVDKVH